MSEALDYQRIRRADAFTTTATVLMDAAVEGRFADDPGMWHNIEEVVITLLEAEAEVGSEETPLPRTLVGVAER